MDERNDTRWRRSGDGSGWEELDLRFDSLRQLETDFVQYLATDGLFVPTADPLPPSSVVRLRLLLPDDFVLLEGTGVVFWVREADATGPAGLPPGMAIRFAALGQQHQDMVDRLIRSLEERGGRPFDLDQAVAATETPAPSPPRSGKPEVARLQVRGGDRSPVADSVPGDPDLEPGVLWAERTISLGVPPMSSSGVGEPSAEASGSFPESAPSPPDEGPSVDATLELAWARAGAALAAQERGERDPSVSEVSVPTPPVEDERPTAEAAWPFPAPVRENLPEDRPGAPSGGREPAPARRPDPQPVVMPDAADEPAEDLELEASRTDAPRVSRTLIGVAAGLGAVAVVALGLVLVDPLGWRGGGGSVGGEGRTEATGNLQSDGSTPAGATTEPMSPTAETTADTVPSAAEATPTGGAEGQSPAVDAVRDVVTTPAAPVGPSSRVVDIVWAAGDAATVVTVTGDGWLDERVVAVEPLSAPPRVLVRLAGIEEGYRRYTLEVGTPELVRIRTGHHPELEPPALFVVLDLADASVAVLESEISGPTVRVTLGRRPR